MKNSTLPDMASGLLQKAYRRHEAFYQSCADKLGEVAEKRGELSISVDPNREIGFVSAQIVFGRLGLSLRSEVSAADGKRFWIVSVSP